MKDHLFFALLLFWCSFLSAQTFVGISGGGGISPQTGVRLALPVERMMTRNFSLQAEAVFLERSQTEVIRNLPDDRDYRRVEISYLSLPLIAKGKLDFEVVSLYGLLGPQVGYALRVGANYLDDKGMLFRQELTFEESMISRFDMGITLGVGLEKEISRGRKIFFDLRHYIGLFDLDDHPDRDIYHVGQVFNLGILFPIQNLSGS